MSISRFKFERECLKQGFARIAGTDEAGRGPLAGPVVAAVVCFPSSWISDGLPRRLYGLNDSKQLTEEEREHYFNLITNHAEISFAISTIEVEVIDTINILRASLKGMLEALLQLQPCPDHILVDGPHKFSWQHPQTPIIDGDAKSFSIAAASVLAKVTRDGIMRDLDSRFPGYGFAEHKGYSTAKHMEALQRLGPCAVHRKSFYPIRQPDPELFQI